MSDLEEIVFKYLKKENVQSIQNFNGHVIVTLVNVPENEALDQTLKSELDALSEVHKTTVVFTKNKENLSENGIEKWKIKGVKKIIGIASGKGGVGKSTTAVNLALALANFGKKIAIFDADIYGPSLPTMLSFENTPPVSYDGKTFEPFENYGIQAMSIGALIDRDTPLVWRGSKAVGAIKQMLTETNWKEVDVMVIDMPPGTGDIQISLSQSLNLDGVVIVSTPQDIALIDAVKGVHMFEKIGVKILGMIENMSYYICSHCGEKAYIFGKDGVKLRAQSLGVKFLGEIALDTSIRENADNGTPIVAAMPDSPKAKAYEDIAKKILETL